MKQPTVKHINYSINQIVAKLTIGILVIIACLQVSVAIAAEHIVERAYFEDTSAQINFGQAQVQQYISYDGILSKGYSNSAFWIRLRIQPDAFDQSQTAQSDKKLILRIRPTYLDEIQLFDPLQPSTSPRLVGDRYAMSQAEYPSLNLNFVVPQGAQPRDIFLRLKTSSFNQIYVEAFSPEELLKSDSQLNFINSIYFALLAFYIFWAIANWITLRERVIGVFAIKEFVGLIFSIAFLGYFRALLSDIFPAPWLDHSTSILIISMVAAAAWLDYNLFREFNPPKRELRVLLIFLALWPLEIVLMLFNETSLALHINATATLFEPLYVLFLALRARTWNHVTSEAPYFPIQLLIGVYTLISLSIIPFVLSGLGYINTLSIFVMNVPLIHSLMTGAVLLFALLNHVRRLERNRVEAVTALAVSKLHFAQEHIKRQEQGKFLDMLTHELKTPLAVMRMMLGSRQPSAQHIDHAERAVRDMNDVIERCRQAGAVDDDQIKINISEFSLESALNDLRNGNATPQRISLSTLHNVLLKTDEQVLRIILANLIDNALKYSPPESRIDILVKLETRNTQPGATICVQNLPGTASFPDPVKVFQKYYRNKSAHHLTGSGLGLYLVENLTKLLNGEIHYVPDQFMIRFSLWIPV